MTETISSPLRNVLLHLADRAGIKTFNKLDEQRQTRKAGEEARKFTIDLTIFIFTSAILTEERACESVCVRAHECSYHVIST